MKANVRDLIWRSSAEISGTLVRRVHGSTAVHYHTAHIDILRMRCQELVEALELSIGGDPDHLRAHIRGITEERISEGYHLREVQLALTVLEEEVWKLCIQHISDRRGLVSALDLVTRSIGDAKDELARVYFEHSRATEATIQTSQFHLDGLFRRMDCPPLTPQ